MKKTPQWWTATPDLVKAMIGSALMVAANGALSSEASPTEAAAASAPAPPPDSGMERRVTALEHAQAVEMTTMRWIVCRFDQEDEGADPRECRHILKPYEKELLPARAGGEP